MIERGSRKKLVGFPEKRLEMILVRLRGSFRKKMEGVPEKGLEMILVRLMGVLEKVGEDSCTIGVGFSKKRSERILVRLEGGSRKRLEG